LVATDFLSLASSVGASCKAEKFYKKVSLSILILSNSLREDLKSPKTDSGPRFA